MSMFELVKESVTCKEIAEKYLGKPKTIKSNRWWYYSPFREETAPSFIADEKGFHDFGECWHGGQIDLVARLFNITPFEAVKVIVKDFGLSVNEYESAYIVELRKKEREERRKAVEQLELWFNRVYCKLCDKFQEFELCKEHLSKYPVAKCYVEIDLDHIDYIITEFIKAKTTNDKLKLYKHREEIEKWII